MIRVGIGGWVYEPWRETFYPKGLKQAEELAYASRHVTSIEINATFYRTQSAKSFRRWADETPDDFVFSLKGPRYATNRDRLGEAGPSIERFLGSGIAELGGKLGPILWQLPPTKRFDPDDLAAFLALLPGEFDGRPLRHALEVRHRSFLTPAFVDLMRQARVPVVLAESDDYPMIADATGDFVYARLQRSEAGEPAGYAAEALDAWARRFTGWAEGQPPKDLPMLGGTPDATPRPCFAYVISGAKERNPAAAMALLARLR